MNRRKFLSNAAGLLVPAAMAGVANANLINMAGPRRIVTPGGGGGGTSVIEVAAAGLSPGDSVTLSGVTWGGTDLPSNSGSNNDFTWINKGWFDFTRRRLGFAVKRASSGSNADTSMRSCVYVFDSNTVFCDNCGFNHQGHVYDCVGYDPTDGTVYLTPGGGQESHVYAGTPTDTSGGGTFTSTGKDANDEISGIMFSGSNWFVSGEGSYAWHPNLFGTGDGGLVIVCHRGLGVWRKLTNVYSTILASGTFQGADVPGTVYNNARDAVIVCVNGPSSGAQSTYRVNRNNSLPRIGDQPIKFGPDNGAGGAVACLVEGPNDDSPYALQRTAAGAVWRLDGSDLWFDTGYTHPAAGVGTAEDFLALPCRGLRAGAGPDPILFVQRRNSGNPADLVLWLPPDAT